MHGRTRGAGLAPPVTDPTAARVAGRSLTAFPCRVVRLTWLVGGLCLDRARRAGRSSRRLPPRGDVPGRPLQRLSISIHHPSRRQQQPIGLGWISPAATQLASRSGPAGVLQIRGCLRPRGNLRCSRWIDR
jgi:hypothetical protein